MTGTALKSVVRLSTEQTSRSRNDTASGAETSRSRWREEAVLMSTEGVTFVRSVNAIL
jgi:hypothetical protein